jgi:hypothetical protein
MLEVSISEKLLKKKLILKLLKKYFGSGTFQVGRSATANNFILGLISSTRKGKLRTSLIQIFKGFILMVTFTVKTERYSATTLM